MHIMGPADQLAALTSRLESTGFRVHESRRMPGGIEVRYREGTGDEADVLAAMAAAAPDAKRGPVDGAPSRHFPGYREG